MTSTTSDNLYAAADYLLTFGWQQGGLGSDGGPRCAAGAIRSTISHPNIMDLVESPEYMALYEHLGRFPATWNDEPGRTVEEVVEAIKAAAVIAAAREVDVQTVTAEPMAVTA